jgi:hypothetical protein
MQRWLQAGQMLTVPLAETVKVWPARRDTPESTQPALPGTMMVVLTPLAPSPGELGTVIGMTGGAFFQSQRIEGLFVGTG